MQKFISLITSLVVVLGGCGSDISTPNFDGARALGYLEQQVAFGPRVPGSGSSAACRDLLYEHFSSLGLGVDSQSFSYLDPYSLTEVAMVNVIASYRGDPGDSKSIALVAHYDCRPRTDYASNDSLKELPIDGANDGASGVAVLMEIANLIAERAPGTNIDFLLVDGEDWGQSGDYDNYCLGSRHLARQGIRDKYHFGLVLDMVGDADQAIYREEFSDRFFKEVNDMVWSVAAAEGIATFIDSIGPAVLDDHLPLGGAGVPTIDIIDRDYTYWHTEFDTPDKCSAVALANVGRVVAKIVYDRSLWPEK